MFAEHFAARVELGDAPGFGDALSSTPPPDLALAESFLRKIDHPAAQPLIAEITTWRRNALDRSYLQTFGRFIESDSLHQLLIEHDGIKAQLAAAESFVLNAPFRSVLIVGDARSGKSSFAMLLAMRAAARGWTVFEAGAAALMAGQQYIGQLEERLQRLPVELAVEKRAIWYVPDFLQLASSGAHKGQTATIFDQILPAITSGRIVMVSEATSAALTTVLQRVPALHSALELVRLPALNSEQTDRLAEGVAVRVSEVSRVTIDPDVLEHGHAPGSPLSRHLTDARRSARLDQANDSARRRPRGHADSARGRARHAVAVDRHAAARARRSRTTRSGDRCARSSQNASSVRTRRSMPSSTGSRCSRPGSPIRDGRSPCSSSPVPPEPARPSWPKPLADFLFGSSDRLIRLDMSEFQTAESTRKIVGDARSSGGRTGARAIASARSPSLSSCSTNSRRPIPSAWDLFLQVFDDGRLTDALGTDHRFPPLHHYPDVESRRHASSRDCGPGFASTSGSFSQELVAAHGTADVPPRVRQPSRCDHRLPPAPPAS